MSLSMRVITMIGMGFQGYAIWAGLTRSLIWPIMWPKGLILYPIVLLIYYIGFCLQNATLASALIRKTQLESEQLAAQKIQETLQPTTIGKLPGYEVDAFYKPLLAVDGDYCRRPRAPVTHAVRDWDVSGQRASAIALGTAPRRGGRLTTVEINRGGTRPRSPSSRKPG